MLNVDLKPVEQALNLSIKHIASVGVKSALNYRYNLQTECNCDCNKKTGVKLETLFSSQSDAIYLQRGFFSRIIRIVKF